MVAAAVAYLLLVGLSVAGAKDKHVFTDEQEVNLWYNKVGPYNNPQETYQYFDLPFCRPEGFHRVKKKEGLGEVLEGNELVDSHLGIHFKVNVPKTTICTLAVDKSIELEFIDAVKELYWYQVYLDDLPQWGMVGELALDPDNEEKTETLIYTHKRLEIGYDHQKIMQLNMTSEGPVPIERGTQIDFTYSVEWVHMPGYNWDDRFRRYLDNNFFEHQIHWFSIFNSFMMVIFLTGIVALILLRTLRKDYAKYAEEDEFDMPGAGDDSGWKQVHGDVFRSPSQLAMLSAAVGNGSQLCLLCIICMLMAIVEHVYAGRGSSLTISIIFYALTSVVGGFVSGSLYAQANGASWQSAMLVKCVPPLLP